MKTKEAYEMSKSSALADAVWLHKHKDENIDRSDREYVSWRNSCPCFLKAAMDAGLGDLDVVFELQTPLGDYIDAALLGSSRNPSDDEFGRLLIVELKQWSSITPIDDADHVEILVGSGMTDKRRHPVSQICEYEAHLKNNHHGIYRNGRITIDKVAYMHNFLDKSCLLSDVYAKWSGLRDQVFDRNEEQRLVAYLRDTFSDVNNRNMPRVVDDCGYVMSNAGFSGLNSALNGEENAAMVKDQMAVVDYVREHLERQKADPHKEIITVSGGPGTGKTIIGMHFIYDYAEIFNDKVNADGTVFCLPKSRTVKAMIDYECNAEVVPYIDRIGRDQGLVVVDEAHRITGLDRTLSSVFSKGTRLLILLQDDHQRIRPGEDGTAEGIRAYAEENDIEYTSLELTIEKRCEALGDLLDGLKSMFYGEGRFIGKSLESVRAFDRLEDMNNWIERQALTSRAKLIAPYCWRWSRNTDEADIQINDDGYLFSKSWNPGLLNEQIAWHYGAERADRVASIYTCQGLDLDDVAFIWWDDLVWDENSECWRSDIDKSKDNMFIQGVRDAGLSQEETDALFINTYYVMLSRARNKMGIWFKDAATKRHVMEFLGLERYSSEDELFNNADEVNTVIDRQNRE